jgi:hypothetical protein
MNAQHTLPNHEVPVSADVTINGESWHITSTWVGTDNLIAWYVATTVRDGVTFNRTFGLDEIGDARIVRRFSA